MKDKIKTRFTRTDPRAHSLQPTCTAGARLTGIPTAPPPFSLRSGPGRQPGITLSGSEAARRRWSGCPRGLTVRAEAATPVLTFMMIRSVFDVKSTPAKWESRASISTTSEHHQAQPSSCPDQKKSRPPSW